MNYSFVKQKILVKLFLSSIKITSTEPMKVQPKVFLINPNLLYQIEIYLLKWILNFSDGNLFIKYRFISWNHNLDNQT